MPAFDPIYADLDSKLPIVLLPVRLETRYFEGDAQNVELRVRIFPSTAHVTTDRPGVDQIEHDETVAYWTTRKQQGDTSAATAAAWQRLTGLFGSARAQWLRRLLTPASDPGGSLTFPQVSIAPPSDSAALLASQATALPTRFFVAGYSAGNRTFLVSGKNIPASVTAGAHDDGAATLWQSDFPAAEAIGLAIRVRIPRTIAGGLSRLLVFGVREAADAASSAAAFQDLLERHIRGEGAALLQPGTPTNNTSGERAPSPPEAADVGPPINSDGQRMARAFGLDASLFAGIGGSSHTGEILTRAMHLAVWPAAPEYFLEQAMSPLFGATALTRAQSLFTSYVRPNGPYATLLLGSQPFGVLPVTSTAFWKTAANTADPVMNGLRALIPDWLAASAKVPRLGLGADPGSDLVDILSQSPVSRRWIARNVESHVIAGRNLTGEPARYQAVVDLTRQQRARTELAPLGITINPLALDFVFEAVPFNLRAPLVAPPEADRNAALPINYIDSIASAGVDALKSDSVPGASPRTILYILLRHATLLRLAKIATQVLGKDLLKEAVFIESTADTVWTRLKTPVASLGNKSVSDVLNGTVPPNAALQILNLHRQALKALSSATVAQLEQLTAGAIDASSHRLDAWISAHATERLAAMRNNAPIGLHLGAYAFIDAPPLPQTLSRDGAAPVPDPDSAGFLHAPRLEQAKAAAVLRSAFLAREGEQSQAALTVDLSSDRVRLAKALLADIQGGASLSAALGARIERLLIEAGLGAQLPGLRNSFPLDSGDGRKRIDGLALTKAWHGAPIAVVFAPVARSLDSLLDAVGDLLLAESVQQYASGHPKRAQVALTALETGAAFPDGFDILRSEAIATSMNWRLVLPVAGDHLDAWIDGLIGVPSQLLAEVTVPGRPAASASIASLGLSSRDLLDFVHDGPDAPALAKRFAGDSGANIKFSRELQLSLTAAYAVSLLIRSSRPLSPDDLGSAAAPIADFAQPSRVKTWLHDMARFRPSLDGLDLLDTVTRARGANLGLHFVSAGPRLNLVSIGPPPTTAQAGMLLDGWNETTPSTEAVTGVAMHYDAPRSRAPQSILIAVPPDPKAGWSLDALSASLLETADLARIRMVRPSDVHGSFLPALYFADNLQADTVATNFFQIAYTTEVKQ